MHATTALLALANPTLIKPIATAMERSFLCSDGVRISARCWRPAVVRPATDKLHNQTLPTVGSANDGVVGGIESAGTSPTNRIMCLHGWLDNAASFHLLAPHLSREAEAKRPTEICAIDFPGHGKSTHKSPDGPPQLLAEYAFYVAEVAARLRWDKFSLVGHSMGAGVSVIYAASYPEHVEKMVLLEGAGPLARNARDCSRHIRAACERRMKSNRALYPQLGLEAESGEGKGGGDEAPILNPRAAKVYRDVLAATEARMDTARRMPGEQYLSEEAARAMVERATMPAPTVGVGGAHGTGSSENMPGVAVTFRHDPRLQWPSLQYFTREQVEALYEDVQCPVCLLMAEDGWPFDQRSSAAVRDILKPTVFHTLPGSHHFHADPDTAVAVAEESAAFLFNSSVSGQ